MTTLQTARLTLEALRTAQAELQTRRGSPGTLSAVGSAIAALTADLTPAPLGCDEVALPLYLTDMWGTGVAGAARLVLTLDIRPSDNGPNAEDEYVVVAHRIEMDADQPTKRLMALLKAAHADQTLEPA